MRANSASLAWAKAVAAGAGASTDSEERGEETDGVIGVEGSVSGRVRRRWFGEADDRGGRGSIGAQCSGYRPDPGDLESHTPGGYHRVDDDARRALRGSDAQPRLPPLVLQGQGPAAPSPLPDGGPGAGNRAHDRA